MVLVVGVMGEKERRRRRRRDEREQMTKKERGEPAPKSECTNMRCKC